MVKKMVYRVSAREAYRRFSDILDRVVQGESVVITRRGEPVAQLIKYGSAAAAEGNGVAWDRLVATLEIGVNLGGGVFDRDDPCEH